MPAIFVVATVLQFWAGRAFYVARGGRQARRDQHEHPRRRRHQRGLRLQPLRHPVARTPNKPGCPTPLPDLRDHRRPDPDGPVDGTARPPADRCRDRRTRRAAPKTARVIRDGIEQDVPVDYVLAGNLVRVRPGEKMPVDGTSRRRIDDRRKHAHRRKRAGRKAPGDRSSARPSTAPARSSSAQPPWAGTPHSPTSSASSKRRRERSRRFSAWPTPSPRISCPASSSPRRHFHRLGRIRRPATPDHGARHRHRRAHHRLPLRARPGDPDRDHGRHRQSRRERRPNPRR